MRQSTDGMLTIGARRLYPSTSIWAAGIEPTSARLTVTAPSGAWVPAAQLLP
jgi:hypothetical protein